MTKHFPTAERPGAEHRPVVIDVGPCSIEGALTIPSALKGLVVFADGSGSNRRSPRDRCVAVALQRLEFATLLIDLMCEEEARADAHGGHIRFDVGLLARRLVEVTEWAGREPATRGLPIGYFGLSTGAAAALVAAARRPDAVAAVVSWGGRPDLAGAALRLVRAPTLLIVGGNDLPVVNLNLQALERLTCAKEMLVVPGATHLFEEPGAPDEVARLAGGWFDRHLGSVPPRGGTAK